MGVASTNPRAATVSPTSLTFTLANYEDGQTVAVTRVPDLTRGADRDTMITFTPRGGGYSSVRPERREVTVIRSTKDDLLVNPQSVTVSEGGSTTYSVALNVEPEATVIVTISSTGIATVSPESLTFTTEGGNWETAQRVTVTGVDDKKVNATDQSAIITHTSDSD